MESAAAGGAAATGPSQALLKRNPAMTREEFSTHWEKKHAPIVVPWALKHGITYYAQIHNPRLSTNTSTSASASAEAEADLDSSAWDGAAEMVFPSATESSSSAGAAMSDPYYQHVILADERRFLVSEALMHLKVVPPGTVVGERRVVIRDGKAVVAEGEGKGKEEEEDEAAKRAWVVWREWEAGRGVVQ